MGCGGRTLQLTVSGSRLPLSDAGDLAIKLGFAEGHELDEPATSQHAWPGLQVRPELQGPGFSGSLRGFVDFGVALCSFCFAPPPIFGPKYP